MKKLLTALFILTLSSASSAYQINGVYASLVSCDYAYSSVRGESGYTGVYNARDELFTVYFGSTYCKQ